MTSETLTLTQAKPSRKRLLMISLPLALLVGAGAWWVTGGRYESTDNAYFHQARITIASDISGRVTSVGFADGQTVKKGDLLFAVDDQPYRLALAQAEIGVDQARLAVAQLKGAYQAALAQEKVAEDDAAYQADQLTRQQALSDKGVGTATALEEAQNTARRAEETAAVARVTVANALTALGGAPDVEVDAHPTVAAALAARDQAAYKLSLTQVTAPDDGVVYQATSFKPGQYLTAGVGLFSFLPAGQVWVEANFKETQLAHIAKGQPAEVSFDVDSGVKLSGHVETIGAGTGSEFALIPAQNATGNWVKVTQRVPVRIVLDSVGAVPVVSGMSAEASVDTGITRSWTDLIPGAGK
ncbi:HlyD family secretion protein [Rhodobacter sp. KR11]|jgi:membrane fusion protein (multidrug efflux system)|uniref:HlyD family secretion protein n=1 Tax=Rhodobacter sp. KR11 TaxID=2974588 RepID=UPI0022216E88|nr:HlyD family secretion protein [Rhodobacter sp. KR11]MCW1919804.1 HlyD family secretion protein [Rhodobacter sp. KR11]